VDKKELRRNSIFLLSQDDKKERDFEFFVFIDPEKEKERPDFLAELHNCLINYEWEEGEPAKPKDGKTFFVNNHEQELRDWLKSDGIEGESYINPLNWLKIAIERYPYRLFVVIDPKKWEEKDCNPTKNNFWFKGNPPPSEPEEWKRSPFLYKRICWVKREEFCGIKEPDKIKIFLKSKWIEYLLKLKGISSMVPVSIHIDGSGGSNSDKHVIKTLPKGNGRDCFENGINNSEICDIANKFLEQNGASSANILFDKHSNGFKEVKYRENSQNRSVLFYTSMSGVQFQLPIILGESWRNKIVGIIESSVLNIGILDERYVQWWDSLNEPEKQEILLFNRFFPIFKYEYIDMTTHRGKEFLIGKNGCVLTDTLKIKIPNNGLFENFKRLIIKDSGDIDLDLLIIHQTKWDELSVDAPLKNIFMLKNKIPYIVITSGRGQPFNLPKGTKFLPFSVLEFFLIKDYPEKLLFLKAAMRLREEVEDE
jgi:hypothetical protein